MSPAPYDRRAAAYDAVLRRRIYQRLFWGTAPASLEQFGREALAARPYGSFAEVGCGSLLFTAGMYPHARGEPVILVDRSLRMLRRGLSRTSHGTRIGADHPTGRRSARIIPARMDLGAADRLGTASRQARS